MQTSEYERGKIDGHWDCEVLMADPWGKKLLGQQEADRQVSITKESCSPWYWVGYTDGLREGVLMFQTTEARGNE